MRAVHATSIALGVALCACLAVDDGSPVSHEPSTTNLVGVDHGAANDPGAAADGEAGVDPGAANDPGGGGEQATVSYAIRPCYDHSDCVGVDQCLDTQYGSYDLGRCYAVCGAHGSAAPYFHGVQSCTPGFRCVRHDLFFDVCRPACAADVDCLAVDRCAPIDASQPKLGSVCVPRGR